IGTGGAQLVEHLGRLERLGLGAVADRPFHDLHEAGLVGAAVEEQRDVVRLAERRCSVEALLERRPPAALLGPVGIGACRRLVGEAHECKETVVVGDADRAAEETLGSRHHVLAPTLVVAAELLGVLHPAVDDLYEHGSLLSSLICERRVGRYAHGPTGYTRSRVVPPHVWGLPRLVCGGAARPGGRMRP